MHREAIGRQHLFQTICVSALKHELGAEELIYGLVATVVAAPHSVSGKIHASCHWRVVGFNDLNVFERPKAS
jgi:hypothetical protein